jgi:hypothetical protein
MRLPQVIPRQGDGLEQFDETAQESATRVGRGWLGLELRSDRDTADASDAAWI